MFSAAGALFYSSTLIRKKKKQKKGKKKGEIRNYGQPHKFQGKKKCSPRVSFGACSEIEKKVDDRGILHFMSNMFHMRVVRFAFLLIRRNVEFRLPLL